MTLTLTHIICAVIKIFPIVIIMLTFFFLISDYFTYVYFVLSCQLTAKNIQCMRTLLNLAHCHGAVLGTSWQLVLATLQVRLPPGITHVCTHSYLIRRGKIDSSHSLPLALPMRKEVT